jgi:hypothetical protein
MGDGVILDELRNFDALYRILEIDKRRELKKHCKDAVIYERDLAALIFTCELGWLPWRYHHCFRDFRPAELELTTEDVAMFRLKDNESVQDISKVARKIRQMHEVRRYLVGHIFHTDDLSRWHLSYFDQRDVSARKNHWEAGSHIHLINYLWPNWNAQSIWDHFTSGNVAMSNAFHIRYVDILHENRPVAHTACWGYRHNPSETCWGEMQMVEYAPGLHVYFCEGHGHPEGEEPYRDRPN